MAVDPRQILAGFLTVTMFVMLANMIKREHFDSVSPFPSLGCGFLAVFSSKLCDFFSGYSFIFLVLFNLDWFCLVESKSGCWLSFSCFFCVEISWVWSISPLVFINFFWVSFGLFPVLLSPSPPAHVIFFKFSLNFSMSFFSFDSCFSLLARCFVFSCSDFFVDFILMQLDLKTLCTILIWKQLSGTSHFNFSVLSSSSLFHLSTSILLYRSVLFFPVRVLFWFDIYFCKLVQVWMIAFESRSLRFLTSIPFVGFHLSETKRKLWMWFRVFEKDFFFFFLVNWLLGKRWKSIMWKKIITNEKG